MREFASDIAAFQEGHRFEHISCRFRFFQYYCPEVAPVYDGRKYGYNLKSQLLKLLVIFPAASALAAWICTLIRIIPNSG